ncbi:MAG: hypothetical protein IJM09_05405, partial [Neisseriaceae bacterium]|nr:hypothetical protein [Neisseriaceae bacterium]
MTYIFLDNASICNKTNKRNLFRQPETVFALSFLMVGFPETVFSLAFRSFKNYLRRLRRRL